MKILKNDTRYIIKKIIIGVGIALILAFLKTNNVFADTINVSPGSIANNFCFKENWSTSRYEVEECPSSVSQYQQITFGIKSTLVGQDIFTYTKESSTSTTPNAYYGFGFENLQNGDMFYIFGITIKPEDFSHWNKFGISSSSTNSFLWLQTPRGYLVSSYENLYITTDYGRALDIYNSNITNQSVVQNHHYRYLSHIGDYYFVGFSATSNFHINDFINYFGSPWVMNQMNYTSEYSSYENKLYVLDYDYGGTYNISLVDDITLDDTSNNLQITNQDYWQQGFDSGGDNWSENSCTSGGMCSKNIDSYLNFFRLPFNFINSLSRNNCSPITLPIPFVNSSIQLPCLSSRFHQVLGDNFYNIIFYIITGVYAYRITILNIDTITDVLNPSDDKLEVVDL